MHYVPGDFSLFGPCFCNVSKNCRQAGKSVQAQMLILCYLFIKQSGYATPGTREKGFFGTLIQSISFP
jgi:hypothetical protein